MAGFGPSRTKRERASGCFIYGNTETGMENDRPAKAFVYLSLAVRPVPDLWFLV